MHPRASSAHKSQTRPKGYKQHGSFTIATATGHQATAPTCLLAAFPVADRKILTEATQGRKALFSFKSEEEASSITVGRCMATSQNSGDRERGFPSGKPSRKHGAEHVCFVTVVSVVGEGG